MNTASQIIAFLGQDAVAERLGVGVKAVQAAVRAGKLPAAWYHALEQMAGRPLPRDCFTFKAVA